MNEVRTTPGPWVVSGPTVMAEAPLRFIATVGAPSDRSDEDAANARLIAAAPELLAALTSIAGMTDPDDPESYRSDDREGCLDAVLAAARAAIASAESSS